MGKGTSAVIVTTPQEVALIDVQKSITFCRQLKVPIVGVVENMSGFVCPKCGEVIDIFKRGGGQKMAAEMGVPFLGQIPIDPGVVAAGDAGMPYVVSHPETETSKSLRKIAQDLIVRSKKAEEAAAS
jgi:MinD-like ATPase involved in chromosome partitioning or flagellar assembly